MNTNKTVVFVDINATVDMNYVLLVNFLKQDLIYFAESSYLLLENTKLYDLYDSSLYLSSSSSSSIADGEGDRRRLTITNEPESDLNTVIIGRGGGYIYNSLVYSGYGILLSYQADDLMIDSSTFELSSIQYNTVAITTMEGEEGATTTASEENSLLLRNSLVSCGGKAANCAENTANFVTCQDQSDVGESSFSYDWVCGEDSICQDSAMAGNYPIYSIYFSCPTFPVYHYYPFGIYFICIYIYIYQH